MNRTSQPLNRLLRLAFIFAVSYMLAEMFGYAFSLVPGMFPLIVAGGVTLVVGGAWQWRRAGMPART